MNDNPCYCCGCYDEDFGCMMPSIDKWYACPLEPEPDWDLILSEKQED